MMTARVRTGGWLAGLGVDGSVVSAMLTMDRSACSSGGLALQSPSPAQVLSTQNRI